MALTPVNFVTFGHGGSWPEAASRLARQAAQTGLFKTTTSLTLSELVSVAPDVKCHLKLLNSGCKGSGYWVWKPFTILASLLNSDEGEIVFYLDAGFEFGLKPELLAQFFLRAQNYGIAYFNYEEYAIFNCVHWSKPETQALFTSRFPDMEISSVPLASAGTIAILNSPRTREIIREWLEICISDNYFHVNDEPSSSGSKYLFFENRHDQSVFSYLISGHQVDAFGSAFKYDYNALDLKRFPCVVNLPIIALRNRTGSSLVDKTRNGPRRKAKLFFSELMTWIGPAPVGSTENNARDLTRIFRAG